MIKLPVGTTVQFRPDQEARQTMRYAGVSENKTFEITGHYPQGVYISEKGVIKSSTYAIPDRLGALNTKTDI